MSDQRVQLERAIQALELQRPLLGDAVVDTSVAALHARLAALDATAAAQPAQQQRQVTILFLDVVGSTALSLQLDPEDVHAVMDGALARCSSRVLEHQGKVLQYAGDNLLAVFGADEAREDDAERAVRCGLALLAEGLVLGEEVLHRHGHAGFNVRVGMHTGGVLLGGGVDAEGNIRGMAVNIAARMEQTAPPGALRISHDCYRQVRGVFDVVPQEPIVVKGVEQPILTYIVQRAKPRSFRVASRGIEGVETRMVGRDVELERMQQAFLLLFQGEAGLQVVTVVGGAGVGKSRLLYEFRTWAEARPERFKLFQGRATPQTQHQPYGLLREVLAWRLQIQDTDSMEVAKLKHEQGMCELLAEDGGAGMALAQAHVLGQLLGLDYAASPHVRSIVDDARQMRNRGFHAAAQMFRLMGARDQLPVVLYLDDLHWADEASWEFLTYLAQVASDTRMLIVGLTRPLRLELHPDWGSTGAMHQRFELQPLDARASRELTLELLKKLPDVPAALRELVVGGAGGNPFYMEELVKMLVDQGAIAISAESWTLRTERLVAAQVPSTLTGVLQARLDGLSARERLTLQQASVMGLVFWDAALAAIDAQATGVLAQLVQRELILPRHDSSLEGAREYAFGHQLLHQVTYETVLKHSRQALHVQAARWLDAQTGVRAHDFLGVIAHHYQRAGDMANAACYFTRAAEQAHQRFAQQEALRHVASALELLGSSDDASLATFRWRLLDIRERGFARLGQQAEQVVDLDALANLAEVGNDDVHRAIVAWRRSDVARHLGDLQLAVGMAREAMALAERAGDIDNGLIAQHRLSQAMSHLDDKTATLELAEDGLARAQAHGQRSLERMFLDTLAVTTARLGRPIAAIGMFERGLQIARELGDRFGETSALGNLGAARMEVGDHAQARSLLEEALRMDRALGNRRSEAVALINLSGIAVRQGEDARALAHAQAALRIATEVRGVRTEVYALLCLGDAELALGRHDAAAAAYGRARELGTAISEVQRLDATAGLARVALAREDLDQAVEPVEWLLRNLAAGGTLQGANSAPRVHLICHQVLARRGDPRAPGLLQAAHDAILAVADAIDDPELRRSYLQNIPEHREVVAAWRRQRGAGEGNRTLV